MKSGMPARTRTTRHSEAFHLLILDVLDEDAPAKLRKATGKFARILATYGGARVTHTLRVRSDAAEPPTAFGRIIGMHERIKKYTSREEGSLPENDELINFGRELFDALFQGDVKRLYDEARSRNPRRKLDLVLTSMIPWLAEKPWEFAYDSRRKTFLATEEVHFVRNALTSIPVDVIEPRFDRLRILVAAAQPVGFGELSARQEERIIRRGFQTLVNGGSVDIDVLPHATPEKLQLALAREQYAILHFIGHGVFADGEGKLVFENQRGGKAVLGETQVRQLLCNRGLSLVFLNSCQSASGSMSEFNKGLAQSLVSHGLPALVANQYSVLDASAASFAGAFYRELARGLSIGHAACEARIAVNCSLQGDIIDWAVPVVYARDPGMVLCSRSTRSPSRRGKMASSASAIRKKRIGIWDMDGAFPSLSDTLDRMSSAQKIFDFEILSLSTPLDIWDYKSQRAPDEEPYLRADKLSARVKGSGATAGVDVLFCITRHWMSDGETRNLYNWWPEKNESKVVVFSGAGFDELPPEGPVTNRVIANVVAGVLAAYLANQDSHPDGAPDCPFDYNRLRDFGRVSGVQKFEKACRELVVKKLGDEMTAAIEKLLKLYQGH